MRNCKHPVYLTDIDTCLEVASRMIRIGTKESQYPDAVREGARNYLTRACELECWHPPIVWPETLPKKGEVR
jgi:hypothetical protein